jgi:hypothetical protein
MRFLYFAYGSNMLTARLTARCPNAKVIGKASALNHALEFTKRSNKDHSGKATIISAGGQSIHTPGVLFEITKSDLPSLDRAEGAGYGYDRHDDFAVRLAATDESVTAMTYIASRTEAHLKPFDWYLALVVAGAHHHELDDGHTQRLRQIEYVIDADLTRDGRADALRALAEHGYDDHNVLLTET